MKLLKSVKHDILTPLLHICNLSLEHGKFPDKLKIAKVVPIFKKGDKQLFDNYRPVSILPAFSKIIEKLVYKRIMIFFDEHNILYNYQFGFRQGRSTEMALFTMTNQFYEAILDLTRAFDTLSHDILLRKLYKCMYGIRGTYRWNGFKIILSIVNNM